MIDIDKVKAAFATTTKFCQGSYYEKGDDVNPHMLCAVSALVASAGMAPALIGKFVKTLGGFIDFASPVLEVEYGIPERVAIQIPDIFDKEENEWRAIDKVIRHMEQYNIDETAAEAKRREQMATWHKNASVDWGSGISFSTFAIDGLAFNNAVTGQWLDAIAEEANASLVSASGVAIAKSGDVLSQLALHKGTDQIGRLIVEPPKPHALVGVSTAPLVTVDSLSKMWHEVYRPPVFAGAPTDWREVSVT